jgi:hypothetical protein
MMKNTIFEHEALFFFFEFFQNIKLLFHLQIVLFFNGVLPFHHAFFTTFLGTEKHENI